MVHKGDFKIEKFGVKAFYMTIFNVSITTLTFVDALAARFILLTS